MSVAPISAPSCCCVRFRLILSAFNRFRGFMADEYRPTRLFLQGQFVWAILPHGSGEQCGTLSVGVRPPGACEPLPIGLDRGQSRGLRLASSICTGIAGPRRERLAVTYRAIQPSPKADRAAAGPRGGDACKPG